MTNAEARKIAENVIDSIAVKVDLRCAAYRKLDADGETRRDHGLAKMLGESLPLKYVGNYLFDMV